MNDPIDNALDMLLDNCLNEKDKTVFLIEEIERIKEKLNERSPLSAQPVNRTRWVKIENVCPNDYNPNSVAKIEMGLLYTSILHDGYTQPIVTIFDAEKQKYIIVDGFHRYYTALSNPDILERNKGYVPVVVIEKSINDRMASTIRHNRARGKHSVSGMGDMVFKMLNEGWSDADICNELGMQPDEVLKLKHITGFSKLFQDTQYKKSWQEANQLRLKKQYLDEEKAKQETETNQ